LIKLDVIEGLITSPYFSLYRPSQPHASGSNKSSSREKGIKRSNSGIPRFASNRCELYYRPLSRREGADQDVQVSKGLFSGALPGVGAQSNAGTLCIYAALNGGHATTGCDMWAVDRASFGQRSRYGAVSRCRLDSRYSPTRQVDERRRYRNDRGDKEACQANYPVTRSPRRVPPRARAIVRSRTRKSRRHHESRDGNKVK